MKTPPTVKSLNNSSVIFIGNSFIYYGNCVIDGMRSEDKGYFYQLAKSNGENVSVYNYTYGGKNLKYIYENHLSKESEGFLSQFDVVFVSEAGENNPNILSDIEKIQALFPSAQLCYLCHEYTYKANHTHIISALPKMREMGIPVADWGGLVYKIWNSLVDVPSSEAYYTRQTFIKDNKGHINGKSSVGEGKMGDNHHQNPLSGYICALMAYCTVTGRPALGQSYSFCSDRSIHQYFDTDAFVSAHYSSPLASNMCAILRSEKEMRGIQALIDSLAEG